MFETVEELKNHIRRLDYDLWKNDRGLRSMGHPVRLMSPE